MAILVNSDTRVIVQGVTGREGRFHTGQMIAFGTNVVGGTRPGKGGSEVDGVPIFDSVKEAVAVTGANCSVIFVPGPGGGDAIMESADAGIPLIIAITEGIPIHDTARAYEYAHSRGSRLIGPNCPGSVSSGLCRSASCRTSSSRTAGWESSLAAER